MPWTVLKGLVAFGCAAALSGCTGPERAGEATERTAAEVAPDPFGLDPAVASSTQADLSRVIAHCPRQPNEIKNQYANFKSPCILDAQGLNLKFDRYFVDDQHRVVAIAGMQADPHKSNMIITKLNGQRGTTLAFARTCIQFGRMTLPELTVASRDKCEALSYNQI